VTVASAFDVLGLPDTATVAKIKARYRELSLTNHPDRGGSVEEMRSVIEAYRVARSWAERLVSCEDCRGSGRRVVRRGAQTLSMRCSACRGCGVRPVAEGGE
jgi:DnaJ-class molecular chaperone